MEDKFKLPENIPLKNKYKYMEIYEKGYDKFIKLINRFDGCIALNQFIQIYKIYNPKLSDSYSRKKGTEVIKKLESNGFINIQTLNRHKICFLKASGFAIANGDYNNSKRKNTGINTALKNDRFNISLMKAQFFIENNSIINQNTMYNHLRRITKDIYNAKATTTYLKYDLKLLEEILKEPNIEVIAEKVKDLPFNNLIRILWHDLYNIFSKLHLQNQTISEKPTFYKLYKRGNELRLHYAPNIMIWDLHDMSYYKEKISILFEQFHRINGNTSKNIQVNYQKNKTLGFEGYNHIGYTLTLIGYNEDVLIEKVEYINRYIKNNPDSSIIDYATYKCINIEPYTSLSSPKTETKEAMDKYIDTKIYSKLSEIINN